MNIPKQKFNILLTGVKEKLEMKNKMIEKYTYLYNHALKSYNDSLLVYQAKLQRLGINTEELGFEPFESETSYFPSGLVTK